MEHREGCVQYSTNKLTREAKLSYYKTLSNKLSDPVTGHKNFWSAFTRITSKKKHANIPTIIHNNIYVFNFHKKPIYLTIILQIIATFFITTVFCLNLFPKLSHSYLALI